MFDYINSYYGLSVKLRGRVEYTTSDGIKKQGTITGVSGPHLKIKMDGEKFSMPYHPKYNLVYLDAAMKDGKLDEKEKNI